MNKSIFYDEAHREAYIDFITNITCREDLYHISLAYLLTLDTTCRQHIDDCFDFDRDVIRIEALNQPWQTSTSLKTTRLAFNLWNGCCDDGEEYTDTEGYKVPLPSSKYAVDQIFSSSLAEYYWQAVKLRFNR